MELWNIMGVSWNHDENWFNGLFKEKLKPENPIFDATIYGLRLTFSLEPIQCLIYRLHLSILFGELWITTIYKFFLIIDKSMLITLNIQLDTGLMTQPKTGGRHVVDIVHDYKRQQAIT